MGYDHPLTVVGATYAASETASRNANKLEEIQEWLEATYKRANKTCEQNIMILEKLEKIQADNNELRQEIMSLREQINKPAPYIG